MSSRKKFIADLLFWSQILLAFVFSIPQFLRLLKNTQGQSLSMQIVMLGFLVLVLSLSFGAHRNQPSRITRQTIGIYAMWTVFISANVAAIFWNGEYQWSSNDSITSLLAVAGASVTFSVCWIKSIGLNDPMPKGILATAFKAVPQFMMALKVASEGGAGVPMITIIVGNITVLIRIAQICFSIREAGWDRNRTWILATETVNELTWLIVSIAWTIWFLNL
jgi:hypothetical protein